MRSIVAALLLVFSAPAVGLTDPPGAVLDSTAVAAVSHLLQQQCSMRQTAQYDAYLATLAPSFMIKGPGIVKQSRAQLAASFAKGKRSDAALQKCDINVVFASKLADGAYAQYTETDTYPDQTITVYDDAYYATSGSGLITRDVQRYSRNVYDGTKLIFGMGKQEFPSTVQLRPTPPPPPLSVKEVEAASKITVSKCDYTEGSGGHMQFVPFQGTDSHGYAEPNVNVTFANMSEIAANRVTFAVVIGQDTLVLVIANGTFTTGAVVTKGLSTPRQRAVSNDPAMCYVTQVVRADGSKWENPLPPPSPDPGPAH